MTQDQLMTLFNKPFDQMNRTELRREYKVQRFMLRKASEWRRLLEFQSETAKKASTVREDKIEYFSMLERVLEAQCEALKWFMDRRAEERVPYSEIPPQVRSARRKQRENMIRQSALDIVSRKNWLKRLNKDGINLSWDRDKFMIVARDRGYRTEESIVYAIGKDLNLDRQRAMLLFKTGKFTWGQVLCVGALLEMTPKEFCDIFMSGYFVESFGNYVASYDIIDKSVLLENKGK